MTMTPDEETVFTALQTHRGRPNGIAGKDLAEQLNLRHRLLRECIETLITIHGVPVGSDPVNGYYLIVTEDEYLKSRHELVTRIVALARRHKALESAYRRGVAQPNQPTLFEEQPIACA